MLNGNGTNSLIFNYASLDSTTSSSGGVAFIKGSQLALILILNGSIIS